MRTFRILSVVAITLFIFTGMAFADLGQGQQQSTDAQNSAASQAGSQSQVNFGDINSHNDGPKNTRWFAPAGEINYPGMPNRFDAAPDYHGYMNSLKVDDLLEYDDNGLTTEEAINMSKGVGGKRILVRAKYGEVPEDNRLDKAMTMPVYYEKVQGAKSLGVIVVVSDSKKAISADVFAAAQVEAWKLGGTAIHVKTQGFQREVHTSGKGIGFSWTGTTISGGQTSAATGVLGFGASWGQAGYYDHPFIIIHVLVPDNR